MEINREINGATDFLREYFLRAGKRRAVIGISGGKDSYVAAALLCRAIGNENVLGVFLPNGEQRDIGDSRRAAESLSIKTVCINIGKANKGLIDELGAFAEVGESAGKNILPRLRMTALYALAAMTDALVVGTTNASELYVGYGTKFGDLGCDVNPLLGFYKCEVVQMGDALGLLSDIVHKAPADGLSSASDEDAFGFSYEELDALLLQGTKGKNYDKIQSMHAQAAHKSIPTPHYSPKR